MSQVPDLPEIYEAAGKTAKGHGPLVKSNYSEQSLAPSRDNVLLSWHDIDFVVPLAVPRADAGSE